MYEGAVEIDKKLGVCVCVIEELIHKFSSFVERRLSDDAPASHLLRIVNAHQHTLEWVQRTAAELQVNIYTHTYTHTHVICV